MVLLNYNAYLNVYCNPRKFCTTENLLFTVYSDGIYKKLKCFILKKILYLLDLLCLSFAKLYVM